MQNLKTDYQEIISEKNPSNIIKAYLEKNSSITKTRFSAKSSFKPKDLIIDSSTPIDTDPNLTRHRSNLIKSRMLRERSKLQTRKLSRDVSSFLDSQILSSIDQIHTKMHEELFNFSINRENPANFCMSTNINELRSQLANTDLMFWSVFGLNNQKFAEYSHEFAELGISKTCQVLPNEHKGPSNRKEAQLLSSWLSFMLQNLLSCKFEDKSELFENVQIVYTSCLKEIFRQISVHCIERGEILQRVWKAYFSILVNTLNVYQKNKNLVEKRLETELQVTKEKFRAQMAARDEVLKEKDLEISNQRIKINGCESRIESMTEKSEKLKQRLFLLQMKYSKDKIRLITLEDEYRNLREVQRIVLEEVDEDFPGIKKVQRKQKFRFRELTKIFMSDPLCSNLVEVPEQYEPNYDVRALIELDKIDLQNKIKMQEIQEKIEETAEELVEIGLDTSDLAIFVATKTQTEFEDFCSPAVDYYSEEHIPQDLRLIEMVLADKIKNEDIDMTELENFFGRSLEKYDRSLSEVKFDISNPEIHERIYKEINEDKQKNSLRNVVKRISNSLLEINKITLEKIKKNVDEVIKNADEKKNETVKLRKQVFYTFKENVKIKDEISKLKEKIDKRPKPFKSQKNHKRPVKAPKRKTIIQEFNLNQKIVLFTKDSVSPAESIFHQITAKKETKVKVNIRNITLLKLINSLISEYTLQMKEDLIPQTQPLYIYLYDYFVTKHGGMKKVVDVKYRQMLAACDHHKSLPLIRLFCRFLGLFEPLEIEYFRTFISINDLLIKFARIGVDIPVPETDDPLIPIARCFEVVFCYFKEKFTENEILNMRGELLKLSKPCPKSINQGVLEKCELVYFVIQNYRNYLILSTNNVKELFEAADLNDDKFLQFEEFDLLFKSIEPKRYSAEMSRGCFDSYSDLIAEVEGESFPAISYKRFSICALEKNLFSKKEQEAFIGHLSPQEIQKKLQDLHNSSEKVIKEFKWRLHISGKTSKNFKDMIDTLTKKLEENDQRPMVYLAYLLINEETKARLLDSAVDDELPNLVKIFEKAQISYAKTKEKAKELRRQISWRKSIETLSDWDEKENKDEGF